MVLIIAGDDLSKPFSNLARTVVLPALKLSLNDFELRDHPLRRRNSPDGAGYSTPEMPTKMSEAQKDEGLRFPLAKPFLVSGGKPPELDQTCLVRM